MSRVMDAPLGSPTDKLVLLVLADYANDDGMNVFPSIATIARRCDMSDRTVQLSLRRMAENGWISEAGEMRVRTGAVTRYRIHPRNLPTPQTTGETDSPVGVKQIHRRGETDSPNPSINHQSGTTSEPSVGESARAFDADAAARAAGIHNQKAPRKTKTAQPPAQPTITPEQLSHFAVSAHREIMGVLLDAFCVQQIIARVTDEAAWRECLTDWRLNPRWRHDNIAGQLDRYARWGEIKTQAAAPPLRQLTPAGATGAARIAEETFARQQRGMARALEYLKREGANGNA